jgi:hypothetical protein
VTQTSILPNMNVSKLGRRFRFTSEGAAGFDSADDSSDSFRLKLDSMDAAAKQIKPELNFLRAGKEQAPGKRRDNKRGEEKVGC